MQPKPKETSESEPSGHLPVLDGIRGLAILLVLVMHFAGPEVEPALTTGSAFERLYGKVAGSCDCGVDLFFVLSGLLITRILLRAKGSPGLLRNFYARRVLRIFPLYYASLAVVFLVVPLFRSLPEPVLRVHNEQLWLWLYAGNVATGIFHIWYSGGWINLTHFWSLAVEEQFYFVWPFLILALSRRRLFGACLGLCALAVVLKVVFIRVGMKHAAYLLTPCRLDALSLGGALAVLSLRGSLADFVRPARMVLVASGAVLLGLLLVGHSAAWLWWTSALVHSAYAWFFAALTVLALTSREASLGHRLWTSRFLKFFGKYSYGIYVVHYALRPAFLAIMRPDRLRAMLFGSRVLELLVFAVVATALSVAAALLTWFVLEKRFLKLKRFFEYVPPASAAMPRDEAA